MSFLKEVLSGKKKVFQNHEILKVNAPRFKELTVAKIFSMVTDQPHILEYLPGDVEGHKLPRDYLFNVSHSLLS
jgi:hypothetical protein